MGCNNLVVLPKPSVVAARLDGLRDGVFPGLASTGEPHP
jgi:hypothetical protein